jgi:translation elongation factor EF-Tu-like GTPase
MARLASLRQIPRQSCWVRVMIVNVGTIGHVDHGTDVVVIGAGQLTSLVVRKLLLHQADCPVQTPSKQGKGQRKANKSNRWR